MLTIYIRLYKSFNKDVAIKIILYELIKLIFFLYLKFPLDRFQNEKAHTMYYSTENNTERCVTFTSFSIDFFCNFYIPGCICTNGWAGNHCDKDLNECDIGIISCSTPNSVCVNTLGSAICSCKSGYFNKAGNCEGTTGFLL